MKKNIGRISFFPLMLLVTSCSFVSLGTSLIDTENTDSDAVSKIYDMNLRCQTDSAGTHLSWDDYRIESGSNGTIVVPTSYIVYRSADNPWDNLKVVGHARDSSPKKERSRVSWNDDSIVPGDAAVWYRVSFSYIDYSDDGESTKHVYLSEGVSAP